MLKAGTPELIIKLILQESRATKVEGISKLKHVLRYVVVKVTSLLSSFGVLVERVD